MAINPENNTYIARKKSQRLIKQSDPIKDTLDYFKMRIIKEKTVHTLKIVYSSNIEIASE